MLKQSCYNVTLSKNEKKEQVLATKIKIIISEHDIEGDEEKIVYNEIIKLKEEEHASPKQIMTALGSVRGIKDRVKERIELFLSGNLNKDRDKDSADEIVEQEKNNKNENKIVIYTTSLGIVRETKLDCLYLDNVFRSLMLKTEKRDIVSKYYHEEFKNYFPHAAPPQVVIKSFPVGGRMEIEELIESGEIHLLTKGIEKVEYTQQKCSTCTGYGYLPCSACLGSCKSRIIRIGKSRVVNNLKCTQCKEGMVRCADCIDMISF